MKKGHATVLSVFCLMAIYFVTLFVQPDILNTIGGAIVLAVCAAGGLHIAGSVGQSYNVSKYYRPELDDKGKVK